MAKQVLDLGTATIEPGDPVEAGARVTLTWTYTAGHPVDDTGFVKIAFRYGGDFARPQFSDPAAADYCEVRTTGDCRVEPRWDPKGHTRPWGAALFLKVMSGYLNRGESITVVFGQRSGGSPGWRVQSFCESTFEFKTLVDPIATYEFKELPESPTIAIVPGPAVRAVCIAPSQAVVGEPFEYRLKLEDRWGNPVGEPAALHHAGCDRLGLRTVQARDAQTGLEAASNPIEILPELPRFRRCWADFHGQSEETIGTNTIDEYFTFARDMGLVSISSHQGNDFQVTDELWEAIDSAAARYNRPGAFVTFPGYEWSANTPLGGDRNVFFLGEGGSIVHSCTDLLPGKATAHGIAPTARDLFARLASQETPAFAFAHVGGRYADLDMHDPEIELGVEVHSAWGTFEWLVEDAFRRGYRVGICANADGHKGRPGASYPGARKFGSYGGLTCVLAERLDRESVFGALKARRFYATTGNRALLTVRVTAGDGKAAAMGEVLSPEGDTPPVLRVSAVGTAPVERLLVRNGLTEIASRRPYAEADLGNRLKIVWSGAEVRGRARVVAWDGGLRVRGCRIENVTPINFWNADEQPQSLDAHTVSWRSVTTGGLSGVILTLDSLEAGTIELETAQRSVTFPVAGVGLEPTVWECGGLGKRIEAYRLPDRNLATELALEHVLGELGPGDNPIYVRLDQEDGHMAWSSPIYVECPRPGE